MTQEMKWSFEEALDRGHRSFLAQLDAAVATIGGNVLAADAIGIDKSALSRSLDNHEERPMRTRWAMGLGMKAGRGTEAARLVCAAFNAPMGFMPIEMEPLSADDIIDELGLHGAIGTMILEAARAKKRVRL